MLIMFSLVVMYKAGNGDLARYDAVGQRLSGGEVREVVCTTPTDRGLGALLRKPDGKLEARVLSKEPPKHFVKTNDEDNPYVPYPGK